MTTHEAAEMFGDLAAALRRAPEAPFQKGPRPLLSGDQLVGAALLWSYLRDLFTVSEKNVFTREELLVLLESLQRDRDLFTPGAIEMIADLWDED